MFARSLKLNILLALLQCISGRTSQLPKFYGQDSAVIVDTDKPGLNPKLQNALYYNIPVYKLFNPAAGNPMATATTKLAQPALVDEYPSDLLYIARNKLGLKRMEQLPSIGELGKLLGTSNAVDTIKYLRTLTANDQGIALMKAYLESLDYEPNDSDADNDIPQKKDNEDDNNADIEANYDEPLPKLDTMSTQPPKLDWPEGGLMQNVNDFMKQYGLWSDSSTTPRPVPYKHVLVAPAQQTQQGTLTPMRPVLVRQPLPYHYPIPLRPVVLTKSLTPTAKPALIPSSHSQDQNSNRSTQGPTTHLNTPKQTKTPLATHVAPHVHQLAQMANISPQVLDAFLQQQPKLAELAKRVSRLPLVQQHSRAIDSQLLMAVKKALSQDENLRRLLGASQTLE